MLSIRPLIFASLLGLLVVPAGRAEFVTQIVGFGDSLSDTGNFYASTGNTFPPSPYWNGRFSNGPVWLEYLADKLAIANPAASETGGTNFAWVSADTGTGLSPSLAVPNIRQQVATFTASKTLTSSQLVTLWGGSFDFLLNGQTDPSIPVGNLAAAITDLSKAGGKQFIVPNLPSLDRVPISQSLTPTEQADLAKLTAAYNTSLKTTLTQLQSDLGVTIHQLDVASLFEAIQADPAKYGLTNVTGSAADDGILDGAGYLFWDPFHPTTAAHALIADAAFAQLNVTQATPEPSTLVLMGSAAIGFVIWRRRAKK